MTRTPGLDTVLHVGFHLSGAEEDDSPHLLPTLPVTQPRTWVAFQGSQHTLSGHIQPLIPPDSSHLGCSPSHHPHPALISGAVLTHVPTLSLALFIPTRFQWEPCPWTGQPGQPTLVEVLLGAIPSFLSVTSSSGAALCHRSVPCCTPLSRSQCPQSNPGYIPGAPRAPESALLPLVHPLSPTSGFPEHLQHILRCTPGSIPPFSPALSPSPASPPNSPQHLPVYPRCPLPAPHSISRSIPGVAPLVSPPGAPSRRRRPRPAPPRCIPRCQPGPARRRRSSRPRSGPGVAAAAAARARHGQAVRRAVPVAAARGLGRGQDLPALPVHRQPVPPRPHLHHRYRQRTVAAAAGAGKRTGNREHRGSGSSGEAQHRGNGSIGEPGNREDWEPQHRGNGKPENREQRGNGEPRHRGSVKPGASRNREQWGGAAPGNREHGEPHYRGKGKPGNWEAVGTRKRCRLQDEDHRGGWDQGADTDLGHSRPGAVPDHHQAVLPAGSGHFPSV